jgi:hypothetical protein
MARILRMVLSTGVLGRADRSVSKAAGAVSCVLWTPARQPLALVRMPDGSTTPARALPRDACETGYPRCGCQAPPFLPAAVHCGPVAGLGEMLSLLHREGGGAPSW